MIRSARLRQRLWRIALWSGSIGLVLLAAWGALLYSFLHTFYPTVPAPDFGPPRSLEEAQHQDLSYFRQYLQYNRTYTPAARAEAARLLDEYAARAGQMTPAQFDLAVSRMVALADNGHSKIYPDIYRRRHNKLPCLLYHFSDGYYVVRARLQCQALLGAELLSIDGHSTAEIVDRMFPFVLGQRSHYNQYYSPFFLESPELLNAAGLASQADRVTLHVRLQDGTEQDRVMLANPPDPKWKRGINSVFYLSSEPICSADCDWKSWLPADARLPLFLTDFTNAFHAVSWPGIYYAGFRSNHDEEGHPIGAFVASIEKQIAEQKPRIVILDLRFDQGGDFTTTAGLMSRVTRLAPSIERVYVLTSPWTFSAGETSVALAKEHGGDKVTIVGELLGDRLRLWGEGGEMTLPNSGLILRYATGLHDYSKPCRGEPGCFWITYFFPMHLHTIAPDVTIPYTAADYHALRDPVLDYVLQAATAHPGPTYTGRAPPEARMLPSKDRGAGDGYIRSGPRQNSSQLRSALADQLR